MTKNRISLEELRKKPTQVNFKSSGLFNCLTIEVAEVEKNIAPVKTHKKRLKVIRKLKLERENFEKAETLTRKQQKRVNKLTLDIGDNHSCGKCFIPIKEKTKNIHRKKRNVRVRYYVYIKSKEWEDRKNKYYQKYEKRCRACRSYNHISLHHSKYGNLGSEKDEHLVPLCSGCHLEYHETFGTQRDMVRKTNDFVAYKLMNQ